MASRSSQKKSSTTSAPEEHYDASEDELLEFYRQMLLIRRFEERAGQMYGMGAISGFCHLYIGQEAIAVGVQSALQKGDKVITAYRAHGQILASGTDPNEVMAELTGRAAGNAGGKGGSMHMFDPENGFYGGHGIVGATVPLGTGLAFSQKYRDEKNITVTFFGDGAANQGQVYESFNMAELWQLPVLYIIENNQYAMGTSVKRSSAETNLYRRGDSFRIPGEEVDGMNVLAVRAAAEKAIKSVRDGDGPMLLEMKTYRYRGHSMSDPAKYRSKDEVQKMRTEQDPINQLKEKLLKEGVDEDALKEIDRKIKDQVSDAADFAQETPEPDESELFTDVVMDR